MWSIIAVFSFLIVFTTAAPSASTSPKNDNTIELDKVYSTELPLKVKLCRPDHILTNNEQCVPLKMSISDLIRDILENSESTLSLAHYNMDDKGIIASKPPPTRVPVSDLFIQNLAVLDDANMSSCLALATCNEHCFSWPTRTKVQQAHEQEVIERFILSPAIKAELTKTIMAAAAASSNGDNDAKGKDDETATAEEAEDEPAGSTPDFVLTIMAAAQKGIEISKTAVGKSNLTSVCSNTCSREFNTNLENGGALCSPMHYDYTVRINAIYRMLIEANATLYDQTPISGGVRSAASPEALYYQYSMRFLDVANLTACFAQVSCENTCEIYKMASSSSSADGNENGGSSHNEMTTPPPPPPAPSSPFLKEGQEHPKAVDVIHEGTLAGYKLALEGVCTRCANKYKGLCTNERYLVARASLAIFG